MFTKSSTPNLLHIWLNLFIPKTPILLMNTGNDSAHQLIRPGFPFLELDGKLGIAHSP